MAIQMVKNAIKKGFELAYVPDEFWIIFDTFISEIQKIKIRYTKKLHIIGLMKTNRYITIKGKNKMANPVPDHNRKNIRYCKKYKCNYLSFRIAYQDNKAKEFWIKMKGSDAWKMLISTDTNISFSIVVKYK